ALQLVRNEATPPQSAARTTREPRRPRPQRDLQIERALELMHAGLSQPWTVTALARRVGLSRAAFARRFVASQGLSPLKYLTNAPPATRRTLTRRHRLEPRPDRRPRRLPIRVRLQPRVQTRASYRPGHVSPASARHRAVDARRRVVMGLAFLLSRERLHQRE